MEDIDDADLDIGYPCPWSYKVVGAEEALLRAAIADVMGERYHTIEVSRTSSGGKYLSLRVEVIVHDGDERRAIGASLHAHADISFVI